MLTVQALDNTHVGMMSACWHEPSLPAQMLYSVSLRGKRVAIFYFATATMAVNFLVNFLPFGRSAIQGIRLVVMAVGLACAYRYGVLR